MYSLEVTALFLVGMKREKRSMIWGYGSDKAAGWDGEETLPFGCSESHLHGGKAF